MFSSAAAQGRLTVFGRLITDGWDLGPARVEMAEGRVQRVVPSDSTAGADLVLRGGYIVPGLIDLQVNGAGGVDLTGAEEPSVAVEQVARTLAAHGVTAFCPTVVSSPPERTSRLVQAYGPAAWAGAATSLGAHLEGPFLHPDWRGVHDPAALRSATVEEVDRWIAAGPPTVVTLAPEVPGALDATRRLVGAGTVVSLGHSGAEARDAQAALAAGARMGTHLFNAMPPIEHRQPGLVLALLASEARLGVIADGVHVDPLAIQLVVRAAGPGRVVLVSDALAAAGMPPGPSVLGDQDVWSDGRLITRADGTIAGSASLLDACLRNARAWLPWLGPADVVRMATQTPAEALGGAVAARKGRVAPGYDADLALLDADWNVVGTVIGGKLLAGRRSPPAVRA